jgi:hypothetical protein
MARSPEPRWKWGKTQMNDLDLTWLMKVRVAVARCGEMDLAKWWNTDGQLSSYGTKMLSRGLPRTHHFAQAPRYQPLAMATSWGSPTWWRAHCSGYSYAVVMEDHLLFPHPPGFGLGRYSFAGAGSILIPHP